MNNIVRESAGELRALGRNALGKYWKNVAVIIVIYEAIMMLIPSLIATAVPSMISTYDIYGTTVRVSSFPGLYDFVLGGVMLLGLYTFMLMLCRTRQFHREHLFSGFNHFLNAFLTWALMDILIGIGFALFIVPGVILFLCYSQALFILADDPTKGPIQCLRESREMMKGNKLSYLAMNLSFIGWAIVAGIAIGILGGVIVKIAPSLVSSDVGSAIWSFITAILASGLIAYILATDTMFYELASGHLVKQSNFSRYDGSRQGFGPQGGGWNNQGPQNFGQQNYGQNGKGWNVPPQQGWAPGNAQQRPAQPYQQPPQQAPQNWYEPPAEPEAPTYPQQPETPVEPAPPAEPVQPEAPSDPKGPFEA